MRVYKYSIFENSMLKTRSSIWKSIEIICRHTERSQFLIQVCPERLSCFWVILANGRLYLEHAGFRSVQVLCTTSTVLEPLKIGSSSKEEVYFHAAQTGWVYA
jgi:hypothetical protein